MDRKASKNGFSVGAERAPLRSLTSRKTQARTLLRSSSPIWIAPFKSTAAKYSTG